MAIKFIPQEWKDDMRTNVAHKFAFYINPRCRVFPSLSESGITYIKNDAYMNMRGTYRIANTGGLSYLYTMPQRFIVEGWFKPEFDYDVAANQTIFSCGDAAEFSIIYNATTDKIDMIQSPGTTISTPAYTTNGTLCLWKYIRAYYDNTAKRAGLYIWCNGNIEVDTENTPGAGTFVPLNTISLFTSTPVESSYWLIHEVETTLTAGQYKTHAADKQVLFDFNGTTLGRERILLKRAFALSDNRGVTSFSISKSVDSPDSGSPGVNSATLTMLNTEGRFSDDQYDAFNPKNGYYNGVEKYLQNRVQVEIESQYPMSYTAGLFPSSTLYPSTTLYPMSNIINGYCEPIFLGRTVPGAFSRESASRYEGTINISIEDGIAEIGEKKLYRSYSYNNDDAAYTFSNPADESLSLVHLITRLATKHEVRNYAADASFENATIANGWSSSGLTLTRDSAYAQFGTYSAKAVSGSVGDTFSQIIKFETSDYIDVGDIFNLSAFVRQGTASTVRIMIQELDVSSTPLATTYVDCGTDTGLFTKINTYRTITNALCTQLRIVFHSLGASTFYVDGVMLIRGIDPIDYFLDNTFDATAGVLSAENAATYLYDTVAIDADTVSLSHPYAIAEEGDTPWDSLKDISEACIPVYLGMTADGILRFAVRYNETDPDVIGIVEDVATISTSMDYNDYNSISVAGVIIDKTVTNTPVIWDGTSKLVKDTGGNALHPIADDAYLSISGVTKIEATYSEAAT